LQVHLPMMQVHLPSQQVASAIVAGHIRSTVADPSACHANAPAKAADSSAKPANAPARSSGASAQANSPVAGSSFPFLQSNITPAEIVFDPVDDGRASAHSAIAFESGKIRLLLSGRIHLPSREGSAGAGQAVPLFEAFWRQKLWVKPSQRHMKPRPKSSMPGTTLAPAANVRRPDAGAILGQGAADV
jgi:hypothetical protein